MVTFVSDFSSDPTEKNGMRYYLREIKRNWAEKKELGPDEIVFLIATAEKYLGVSHERADPNVSP